MTKAVYPSSGDFTATSPNAYTCATVRDFIVIGALEGDLYSVQWSAIGDPTSWPTPATDAARAVQSGKQTLPNRFGYVTAIAGNDFYGYIFQERAITKMTYVGSDVVFSFDTFEEGRGCVHYNRIARVDDKVFFESEFGRHLLENDIITDIGYGILDDTY